MPSTATATATARAPTANDASARAAFHALAPGRRSPSSVATAWGESYFGGVSGAQVDEPAPTMSIPVLGTTTVD